MFETPDSNRGFFLSEGNQMIKISTLVMLPELSRKHSRCHLG
jgi:hypothetical protein